MENPYVDCIGHLTARKIGRRAGVAIDLERVIEKAVETGTASRSTPSPTGSTCRTSARAAAGEAGLLVPVTTDAHRASALDYVELGIGQARRAWLTKKQVLNTRTWAQIEQTRKRRAVPRGRRGGARVGGVVSRARGRAAVLAQVEPGWSARALPASPPEQGEPFSAVLRDVEDDPLPAVTHWQHPRFFAYFANHGSEPAILAELLAAALNQNGILWRTAPASTELEGGRWTGWRSCSACLRAGTATSRTPRRPSTLDALAAARELHAGPARRRRVRARALLDREGGHDRSSSSCGGRPSTTTFRMRPDALDLGDACAVVATVGTTSTTSVDPVPAIADACEGVGAWLHVDAAYAGSAMVCPELRWAFEGVERADSLVVNAHKWMLTRSTARSLWTSRPEDLRRAFSLVPEYLRTPDDGRVASPSMGLRSGAVPRAEALGGAALLRARGPAAADPRARAARRAVRGLGAGGAGLGALGPAALLARLLPTGGPGRGERGAARAVSTRPARLFLSHTKLDGRYVLRLAIGQERTTEDDVRRRGTSCVVRPPPCESLCTS